MKLRSRRSLTVCSYRLVTSIPPMTAPHLSIPQTRRCVLKGGFRHRYLHLVHRVRRRGMAIKIYNRNRPTICLSLGILVERLLFRRLRGIRMGEKRANCYSHGRIAPAKYDGQRRRIKGKVCTPRSKNLVRPFPLTRPYKTGFIRSNNSVFIYRQ
jgi:hypothetical protein